MAGDNQEVNPTFFFLNKIDGLRDPVRNTRWRLLIPQDVFKASGIKVTVGNDFGLAEGVAGTEDFALHVKTCAIPDIELTEDKHWYMGFGSSYPVNAKIDADLQFQTILLEDVRAFEAMIAWSQACLNTGLLAQNEASDGLNNRMTEDGGLELGLGQHKDKGNLPHGADVNVLRNSSIRIELYNWMRGDRILQLKLINAYPTKVEGPKDFKYTQDAAIQNFNFTLHCDRWTLYVPKDNGVGFKE